MTRQTPRSPRVSAGETLYRLLLFCYPADVRKSTALDMLEIFRDMCSMERRRSGAIGVALFTIRACAEVPGKAIQSHWGRRSVVRANAPQRNSIPSRHKFGLDAAFMDIRFALRSLRKRPLFTIVAICTLGLGIGSATAMFSVVDGVLLRQLPYREPGRLVTAWIGYPSRGEYVNFTDDQYRLWRQNSTLFQDVAIYNANAWGHGTLTGSGRPERVSLGTATASLLPVLGVESSIGRWFSPDEEGTEPGGAAPVVVISHEFRSRAFGDERDVLGRTIELDGIKRAVIGVLPEGFRLRWLTKSPLGTREIVGKELWLPFGQSHDCIGCGSSMYQAVGRLRPNVTVEQAVAETATVLESTAFFDDMTVRLVPRHEDENRGLGQPLVLLLAATGLLLAIACGNIATLSLGELRGRRTELATRSALGASNSRVVRQLLTESLLLGIVSSGVGVLLAKTGTKGLLLLAPPVPRIDQVGVSGTALAFAVALGFFAGVLFGTAPSILAARDSIGSALRASGCTGTGRNRHFQNSVLVLEVAFTAVLLVTGGLLTRSLSGLLGVEPGFNPENMATAHVSLPEVRYPTQVSQTLFVTEVIRELKAIPGVQAVTAANNLPFPGTTAGWGVRDEEADPNLPRQSGKLFHVMPGYHEMMGIRLLDGRTFTEEDHLEAPSVALVGEEFARRLWPDGSPIGRRLVYPWTTVTVVGVVADVRRETLGSSPEPVFYVPFSQFTRSDVSFAVRTSGDAALVLPQIREAIWSVDGDLAITQSGTMASLVARSASDERYRTLLMSLFGVLASALAAVGVFGVTARAVAHRTREMGIRMALGASDTGMVTTILRGSIVTGLIGIGVGIFGALWLSSGLSDLLFEIEPSDPVTYVAVACVLLALCVFSSYLPARRIARVDPVEVLRAE